MRVDVFFFLIISFEISSSARNKSKTNSTASGSHFCDRDRGEILFKAQAVILARVRRKKVLFFTAYNTRSSPRQQRIGRLRSWSKSHRLPPPMSTPMSSPLLPPPSIVVHHDFQYLWWILTEVWKEREQGLILPKEQLLLKFEPTACRRLKKGKKYVFSLDPQRAGDVHSGELIEKTSNGEVWKPSGPPMSHSSRYLAAPLYKN